MQNNNSSAQAAANTTSNTTNLTFSQRHAPKIIPNLVFSNSYNHSVVTNIASRKISGNLALSGNSGTGKTSICKLLPFAITGDKNVIYDTLFINAGTESTKSKIVTKVANFASTIGYGDIRFVIIDEFDCLDKAAQDALKGEMEKYESAVMFMLTTNNLKKIDKAIISRCFSLEFDGLKASDWVARAKQIIAAENKHISDCELAKLLDEANGDGRKVMQSLELYVATH